MGLAPAVAGAAGWSRPFALSAPQATDIAPAQVTYSATGKAAVAFAVADEDNPASSRAFVTLRSPAGRLSAPRAMPGAQQVLGMAFDGLALELLTGSAPAGYTCCSSVAVSALQGGAFGRRRTLLSGLTGATVGSLMTIGRRQLLATVATDRGVWVSGPAGTRRVSPAGQTPGTLAASAPGAVAWTATTAEEGASDAIYLAPGRARSAEVAVTVPVGHQVDELSLMPGRGRMTAAWVESWVDAGGAYQSQVVVRDLRGGLARAFTVPGQTASGLTASGDQRGDQVVAWKTCDAMPSCRVRAVFRRAGGRFGAPVQLGPADPYEDPAAAISSGGEALVGRISQGRVLAVSGRARGFTAPRVVSASGDASSLMLAFGPGGEALAVWTAGAATPQLMGAELGGRGG